MEDGLYKPYENRDHWAEVNLKHKAIDPSNNGKLKTNTIHGILTFAYLKILDDNPDIICEKLMDLVVGVCNHPLDHYGFRIQFKNYFVHNTIRQYEPMGVIAVTNMGNLQGKYGDFKGIKAVYNNSPAFNWNLIDEISQNVSFKTNPKGLNAIDAISMDIRKTILRSNIKPHEYAKYYSNI